MKKIVMAGLLVAMLDSCWAQSCPKEPPFPNTNDINVVIDSCKKNGGTWKPGELGYLYGHCDFPPDWCKKTQTDNNISMPLPRNQQEFATQLFAVAATTWFNGFADKLKNDQQRAEQAKLQQQQLLEQRRQQQLQQRQQAVDRLLGNTEKKGDDLRLVFDDSSLGVTRKAGAPEGKQGDLTLVFDDSALGVKHSGQVASNTPGYGINGLPGIYTNGPSDPADNSSGGYGINGLPGVYTGGPKDPATAPRSVINRARFASSAENLPGVYLGDAKPETSAQTARDPEEKTENASGYGIPKLPGTYTGGARDGETGLKAPTIGGPTDAIQKVAKTPANEANNGAGAGTAPTSTVEAPRSAVVAPKSDVAMQQLQHTSNESQRAAQAKSAEQAAHLASQPFDNGNRTKPAVDLRGTGAGEVHTAGKDMISAERLPASPVPFVPRTPATNSGAAASSGGATATKPTSAVTVASNETYDPNTEAAERSAKEMPWEAKLSDDEFDALKKSGIMERHAEKICDYVQQQCKGTIIMQSVNPAVAKWIDTGMATPKLMSLKVKTAVSGELAGLIPCRADDAGHIVEVFQAADPKKVVQEQCPDCRCVEAKEGKRVLADANGFFFVSDYDPYVIHCAGDDGQLTNGEFGVASENQRKNIRGLNGVLTFPVQHGAGYDYDGVVKLPATVFEFSEPGDRCYIRSLDSEAKVKEYLRDMGLNDRQVVAAPAR